MSERTIRTDYLARVEGEGAMYVRIEDDAVRDVRLRIYEPPRFFEALLRGRAYTEPPDITARICGICPVAYQMSAVRAIEDACGVHIDNGPIRDLRRLLYCGEWIESHALHVFFLHAPDFLGLSGFVELAGAEPELAERALALKRTGNRLIEVVGGRAVHPINVRVGGFYGAPPRAELRALAKPLAEAREIAIETVAWASRLEIPDVHRTPELVALTDPDGYPIDRGEIATSGGLRFPAAELADHVVEEHVEHSHALHARLGGRTYLTGPLARFALNADRLTPLAAEAARSADLDDTACANPFRSIIVRAVELVQACDEALALVAGYDPPAHPSVEVVPRSGVGHAATEAPRGLLYHRYELDARGGILAADIIPPTSQNQLAIEADVRAVVEEGIGLADEELRHRCEQAIRNHDPCISCATHFLTLTVDRS